MIPPRMMMRKLLPEGNKGNIPLNLRRWKLQGSEIGVNCAIERNLTECLTEICMDGGDFKMP